MYCCQVLPLLSFYASYTSGNLAQSPSHGPRMTPSLVSLVYPGERTDTHSAP